MHAGARGTAARLATDENFDATGPATIPGRLDR